MSSVDNSNKFHYQTSNPMALQFSQQPDPQNTLETKWFSGNSGDNSSSPITPTPHSSPRKIGFRARHLSDNETESSGPIKRKFQEIQQKSDKTGREFSKKLKPSYG